MSRFRELYHLLRGQTPPPPTIQEFGGETAYEAEAITLRMRRPIVAGSIIMLVFVVGLFLWAALSPINGAVIALGQVKVEGNSKEVRHLDAGILRRIYVHEGQFVRAGQLLISFDDTVPRTSVDVYQAAIDSGRAQIARFQAEATNASTITFPQDLLNRSSDPRVQALLESQRTLFLTRMQLYRTQSGVMQAQIQQLQNQTAGLRAQVAATDGQSELIQDELGGVKTLNKEGYAPRTRLLELQRSAVGLKGQRGSQMADIARTGQAINQIRIQLAQLDDKRASDAADGIRATQDQVTDTAPKLRSSQQSLNQIEMRAPVDGYVFNLTQRTEGAAVIPAELLMSIVPSNSKVAISVKVRPNDIADVKVGMQARVTLTAYNPRTTPSIDGKVELVSADAAEEPQTHAPYYEVRVTVDPSQLTKAGPKVKLSPGMPAMVAIVTSKRSVLGFLLGPLSESMHGAMHER